MLTYHVVDLLHKEVGAYREGHVLVGARHLCGGCDRDVTVIATEESICPDFYWGVGRDVPGLGKRHTIYSAVVVHVSVCNRATCST